MNLLQLDSEHSSREGTLKQPLPISAIDTPALLVDAERLRRNLRGMQALADRAGVRLRPHAKSHKCAALGGLQLDGGAAGLCVAKVSEAQVLVLAGFRDLLVAYPLVGPKAEALAAIAARHPDGRFEGVADSLRGLDDLGRAASRHGITLGVWIEVDTGLQRSGLEPGDPTLEALVRRAGNVPGLRLRGLITHAGHAYAAPRERISRIGREEGETLVRTARDLERAGSGPLQVGLGSTPTAAHAARVEGVDEIHPGVYVFGDRQQVALGSMRADDVALSVLCTVVSRPSPGRLILDAGSKTLSSDRGAHGTESVAGFGTLRRLDAHRSPVVEDPLPFAGIEDVAAPEGVRISRLSEEHGIVESGSDPGFEPGDRLEVLPNHACAAVNLARVLCVTEGEGSGRRVVAVWPVTARARVH